MATISKTEKRELIKEIMQNFPEASVCLDCIEWDYEKMFFRFVNNEEDKEYIVTTETLLNGFDIVIEQSAESFIKWRQERHKRTRV